MRDAETFLAGRAAAERDGDAGTLESLLSEGFTAVSPLGFILPKAAWLARHRSRDLTYQQFGLDEVQGRPVGDDPVVVTARNNTRGSYQGHPIPEATRATLVLAREAGSWKLAAIHLSFIAGTPGAPPVPGSAGNRTKGRDGGAQ
jgi:hypothetical protein